MRELICPNCGKAFSIDETSYDAIVRQVRNHEFDEELKKIEERNVQERDRAVEIATLQAENKYKQEINNRDMALAKAREERRDSIELALRSAEDTYKSKIAQLSEEYVAKDAEVTKLTIKILFIFIILPIKY